MKRFTKKYLLIVLISLLSLYSIPVYAQTSSPLKSAAAFVKDEPETSAIHDILPQLKRAKVVYLGETHDRPEDHQIQLDIIQSLHQQQPKVAIALEMFQRPYQQFLDQYVAGSITEQELIKKTEYDQRWGFPWEYYAPILRYARANKLPLVAINLPSEITRQVAQKGFASLTPQQRQLVPPLTEIRTDNVEYRQMLLDVFTQHQQAGHGASGEFEKFLFVQVLWDETMAQNVAQFLTIQPQYQIIVLAGQAHIAYGYGIPDRVARRLPKVVQRSVLFSVPEQIQPNKRIADFILDSSKTEVN